MNSYIGEYVLITTNDWFFTPDGKECKAVWGKLKGIHEAKNVFGFVPSRTHTNWLVEVGNMVLMGCRVMYCIKCPNKPNEDNSKGWTVEGGVAKQFDRPSVIYFTDDEDNELTKAQRDYEIQDILRRTENIRKPIIKGKQQ